MLDTEVTKYERAPFPKFERYGTSNEWLSPRFLALQSSWWLQGQLIKPDTEEGKSYFRADQYANDRAWWKEIVDKSAFLVTQYIDNNGGNVLASQIFTGFLSRLSSTFPSTFHSSKELICDAVACLLTSENMKGWRYMKSMCFFKTSLFSNYPKRFSWSPCDLLFLATCFSKDIAAVRYCLTLVGRTQRDLEDSTRLRFAGLYVAVRQNDEQLVSLLLASGLEISDENWPYVLCAAVETGSLHMLEFFLRPEFSAKREVAHHGQIFIRASEYTNTTVRIEMFKKLTAFFGEIHISLRTRILVSACRSNDIVFAKWILETGPVAFYNDQMIRSNTPNDHPMLMAVNHGSTEMVHFLLRSKFEVFRDNEQYILHHAFCHAQELGRFDIFMELVPHQTRISREKMLFHSVEVDHALEAVDKLLGLADVTPSKASATPESLDSLLVGRALQYRSISNIEWLLRHGFRTQRVIHFNMNDQPTFRRHKSRGAMLDYLREAEDLLKAYDNPGIDLRCSSRCTAPKKLSEVLQLPRPWEHEFNFDHELNMCLMKT